MTGRIPPTDGWPKAEVCSLDFPDSGGGWPGTDVCSLDFPDSTARRFRGAYSRDGPVSAVSGLSSSSFLCLCSCRAIAPLHLSFSLVTEAPNQNTIRGIAARKLCANRVPSQKCYSSHVVTRRSAVRLAPHRRLGSLRNPQAPLRYRQGHACNFSQHGTAGQSAQRSQPHR